ncbi:MAG: hypothetical protein QNJ97_01845 [Myxococcota bacterium]|nr:hypothetical protein [Myxococcota bacterium]
MWQGHPMTLLSRQQWVLPRWIPLAVLLVSILSPHVTSAQEYEYSQFERAKNAYERGEYEAAVSRFESLLKSDLKNPALALECRKLAAVSYLFIGDRNAAEKHFTELLILAPTYELDPMLFPIEVVDFFVEVKQKAKARLEALQQARMRKIEEQKAEAAAKRAAELEKLRRNIYVERTTQQRSLLVAFMPFGAGQFQNGHTVKGALFLSGELLLAAATVSTYFLHEGLRDRAKRPVATPAELEKFERLETTYRIVNQASLVALGALTITGIIDALINYQAKTVTWRSVDEKEVPESLRPGKTKGPDLSLAPSLGEHMLGFEITGRF